MKEFSKEYNCGFAFVCDSWVSQAKKHILGVVISASDMWFPHDDAVGKGNEIKDDEHNGINVAKQIEEGFLKSQQDFDIIICCVCTDDAGQCARGKRILSLRYPQMYFGKCYAHQVHLIVKGVFKIIYVEVVERARKLINKYNQSTSKWLVRLDKASSELYGKSLSLLRVVEVRWNSIQAALASILRIQSSLRIVCATYESETDFPAELKVDEAFFQQLKDAERAIRPLSFLSFLMQRDQNTLADVCYMFGSVFQEFSKHETYSVQLTSMLEKRWKSQEHPLIMMTFMLHPKFYSIFREMSKKTPFLSLLQVSQFAVFYYKKFIGNEFGNLVGEVQKWYNNEVPAVMLFLNTNCFQFWNFTRTVLPNLAALATKLLSFVVQSASCERLFSSFGNLITKDRNRLSSENAHYLTQVKRNVKIFEENTEFSNEKKKKKKKIFIDPTERKKTNLIEALYDTGLTRDSASGNDSNDDTNQDTNDSDDEGSDERVEVDEVANLTSDFIRILDLFEEQDEELYIDAKDTIKVEDMSKEVVALKYDDGEQYRTQNPYPEHNTGVCQQEKLKGTRAVKIDLITLFPTDIKLPSLDEL